MPPRKRSVENMRIGPSLYIRVGLGFIIPRCEGCYTYTFGILRLLQGEYLYKSFSYRRCQGLRRMPKSWTVGAGWPPSWHSSASHQIQPSFSDFLRDLAPSCDLALMSVRSAIPWLFASLLTSAASRLPWLSASRKKSIALDSTPRSSGLRLLAEHVGGTQTGDVAPSNPRLSMTNSRLGACAPPLDFMWTKIRFVGVGTGLDLQPVRIAQSPRRLCCPEPCKYSCSACFC